jgi:hypothetical protein
MASALSASMADVVFTDIALLHIRAVIATSPFVRPVVSVMWWRGVVGNNTRNPDGSVCWETSEDPKWIAFVSDWYEIVAEPDPDTLPKPHGFPLYLDKRAKEAPGKLMISLTEEGLAVEHSAI